LHDVGKVKIPDDILNKEGNLNDEEFAIMKMHTVHGKKLLLGQANLPDIAAEIAFSHHEKVDGSGYPNGLTGDKIPFFVKIVAVVDAYDAITSGRIYCEAKPPAEAMRLLVKSKGQHHDAELVDKFIECVGIYPLGALAELSNGALGFVLPGNEVNKLQPKVLVVSDDQQQECAPHVIDISQDRRTDNQRPYMIRALHEDGKHGFSFAEYHEQALRFVTD
jgi:HD-GYP domain-containing protein (c-di-GMP phosphodiesterase class II)